MASAEPNPELLCCLCQKIYTDPVTLKCGHNFCRICIEDKLKGQDKYGFYTCPTCGKRFNPRPSLQTNRELSDRVTGEQSTVPCMFCPLPAAKECVQCGRSLCDGHLATHNKMTHRLINPISLENRECPIHDKLLDYYCTEDDVCICHDCSLLGDHKGHNVESLEEACKKKKEEMQKVLQNLVSKREHVKKKFRELIVHMEKEKGKARLQRKKVFDLFKTFNQQIESIKNDFLKHTSDQKIQIVKSVQKQIDMWKDWDQQLSTKIHSIDELYKIDDPLRILQNWKFDEEIGTPQEEDETKLPTFMEIDENQLLQTIKSRISNISTCLPTQYPPQTGPKIIKLYHKDDHPKDEKSTTESSSKGECSTVVPEYGSDLSYGVLKKMTLKSEQKHERKLDQSRGKVLKYHDEHGLSGTLSSLSDLDRYGTHEFHQSFSSPSGSGFEMNKPPHKDARSKDENVKTGSPNEGESSNVVPKIPTVSSAPLEKSHYKALTHKWQQTQSNGRVLICCKTVRNDFLVEVYLVTTSKPRVKEVIEKQKVREGFRWIDKPSYINLGSTDIKYILHASEGVKIVNKNLLWLDSESAPYPHVEIRVPFSYAKVKLHISKEGKKAKIWSCELNNKDLHRIPETPPSFQDPYGSDVEDLRNWQPLFHCTERPTFRALSESWPSQTETKFLKIPEPRIQESFVLERKETKVKSETMTSSIQRNTYRLNMKSTGLYSCPETRIQFQVKLPMNIEYELESWSNHMTDTLYNGYQIISPLFNISIQWSSHVSAVYLPHYLSSKDYDSYKSYIKLVHFKDGKVILESPTRIEASYIVLENPTFSFVGVLLEKFWTFIMRPIAFNGIVLIYVKTEKKYRLRLYTMIDYQPNLKKIIDKEIGEEFRWIDMAPQVESVYTGRRYVIQGLGEAEIEPEVLSFRFTCPSSVFPCTDIKIEEPSEDIDLCIAEKGSGEVIWRRHLTKDDLTRIPVTSSACTSSSDSRKAKSFLQNNYGNLCKRLGLLDPLLLSLRAQRIMNEHEEESIRNYSSKIQQREALLRMVTSKGVEEEFYNILKENDFPLVQSLEQPTTQN